MLTAMVFCWRNPMNKTLGYKPITPLNCNPTAPAKQYRVFINYSFDNEA
jgi:hypothetical protein